jgi:transmembrane sensor
MSKSDPTAAEIALFREASEWVQRLNESNEQALTDQWMRWCAADAMNLPAFEQMQRLWNSFREARAPAYPPAPIANRSVHRNRLIAWAASVVLLVVVAAWFTPRHSEDRMLETAVGEQRRITLADGSRLDLAPDSLVGTHFTLARRDVRLVRGQAFFSVAHSAVRPFIVHADRLTVTAVGTEFDVRINPGSTAVTVSEGRVTVTPDGQGAGSGSRANAEIVRAGVGQRVMFSQSAHRLSVAAVDPKAAGAWRDGTLLFVGEPLEDVINAINRYTAPQIVVVPAFQQTRFTGTVSPSKVRDWLKALEQIYPVEVVDQGANGVLIRSRAHDSQK